MKFAVACFTAKFVLGITATAAAGGVASDDSYAPLSEGFWIPNKSSIKNYGNRQELRVCAGKWQTYLKFDLSDLPPAPGTMGSDIAVATLRVFVSKVKKPGTFDVKMVHGDWAERTVTQATGPSAERLEVSNVPVTRHDENSFVTVDVTPLVRDWVDGVFENDGLTLVPSSDDVYFWIDSKENKKTGHAPFLDVVFDWTAKKPQGQQGPSDHAGSRGRWVPRDSRASRVSLVPPANAARPVRRG